MARVMALMFLVGLVGCAGKYIPPCETFNSSFDVGHIKDRYPCVGACLYVHNMGNVHVTQYKHSIIIVDEQDDVQCQEIKP